MVGVDREAGRSITCTDAAGAGAHAYQEAGREPRRVRPRAMKITMKLALSELAAGALTGGLQATAWCGVDQDARQVVINVGPHCTQPTLQGRMTLPEAREFMAELQAAIAGLEMLR